MTDKVEEVQLSLTSTLDNIYLVLAIIRVIVESLSLTKEKNGKN